MMKKAFQTIIGLIFLFHSVNLMGKERFGVSVKIMPSGNRGPVTSNKYFFSYGKVSDSAQQVSAAIKSFRYTTEVVEQMLYHKRDPENIHHLPAWAGLYANHHLLRKECVIDKNSPVYMLSLMYLSQFPLAEKVGLAIISKEPDNYAAILLLGMLSIYKKEYFVYFEKAFLIAPEHTLKFFDWHFNQFRIYSSQSWDFVDAFFHMLARHIKLWSANKLSGRIIYRMQNAFISKYGDYKKADEKDKISNEFSLLIHKFTYSQKP